METGGPAHLDNDENHTDPAAAWEGSTHPGTADKAGCGSGSEAGTASLPRRCIGSGLSGAAAATVPVAAVDVGHSHGGGASCCCSL